VVEWWSGGVVEWWSGGVVEWWSGGVVEWWSGGVLADAERLWCAIFPLGGCSLPLPSSSIFLGEGLQDESFCQGDVLAQATGTRLFLPAAAR
jgi:hypothetical protein